MPFYKAPPVNAILSNSAATLSDLTVDENTLVIDETNNFVGIGTSTPSRPLTVVTAENEPIRMDNTQEGGDCVIGHRTSHGTPDINWAAGIKGSDDSYRIANSTNVGTNDRLVISSAGFVAIGTESASRPLTVAGVENEMVRIDNTLNGGDCVINLRTSYGTDVNWAAGIKGSDDSYRIANSANVGTNDRLTIDSSGDATFSGGVTTTGITIGATAVTASGTELNYVDGVTSAIQTQLDAKGVIAGSNSLTQTGALNAGSITSGFGNIDVGSSTIDTTGAVGTGALTVAGDAVITGGDITLGASADANPTAIVAVTETGTDTNGKTLTIGGGLGTGAGLPGSVTISSGIPGSSGSTAHNSTPVAVFDTYGATLNFGGVAALANDTGIGEKVYFGTEDGTDALAAGRLMCLNTSGVWKYADADAEATTNTLLAIALGTAVSDGLLVKGYFKLNSYIEGSFAKGAPCFVSEAAGEIDFTAPSASSDFLRVVGYGIDTTNVIYFNPSGNWIEL